MFLSTTICNPLGNSLPFPETNIATRKGVQDHGSFLGAVANLTSQDIYAQESGISAKREQLD